jgi:hypothetical protein
MTGEAGLKAQSSHLVGCAAARAHQVLLLIGFVAPLDRAGRQS